MNWKQLYSIAFLFEALKEEFPHNENIGYNCDLWLEEFEYIKEHGHGREANYPFDEEGGDV